MKTGNRGIAGPHRLAASRVPIAVALAASLVPQLARAAQGQEAGTWTLQVEAVGSWQQRNSVQSPNDSTGTRFALDEVTGNGPFRGLRIEAAMPLGARQQLNFLIAPLAVNEPGRLPQPLRFDGGSFTAGPVDATYRFDSYRVGWRWLWIDRPELTVKFGATAKIRDAEIRLRQGSLDRRETDTGFVPLAHASFERRASGGWFIAGDIDALGGGPGYAIDAGLRVGRRLGANWSGFAGLRFLDGGADTDAVYAFARFTSLTVGLRYRR